MAAASISPEPGETECPVCSEDFTDPKILPCYHILCRRCLVSMLDSDTEALCPLCRRTIVDTSERFSKSIQDIADALPTDLAMAAIVKSSAILKGMNICCVCPNVAAVAICLDCNDTLCRTCAVGHTKLRVTRHHKVEDLTSLTAENLAAKGFVECTVHSDELCKLYCTSHAVSICQTCATTKHRACPEVVELDEKANKARASLDEMLSMLTVGEADLENAALELSSQLQQIDKTALEGIEEVDSIYDSLKSCLEARCHDLKEMIKRNSSEAKDLVSGEKMSIGTQRGRLASHRRLVERARESTPYSDLGNMADMLQGRAKDLDFSLPKSQVTMKKVLIDPKHVSQIKEDLGKLGQPTGVCGKTSEQIAADFKFQVMNRIQRSSSDTARTTPPVISTTSPEKTNSPPMMQMQYTQGVHKPLPQTVQNLSRQPVCYPQNIYYVPPWSQPQFSVKSQSPTPHLTVPAQLLDTLPSSARQSYPVQVGPSSQWMHRNMMATTVHPVQSMAPPAPTAASSGVVFAGSSAQSMYGTSAVNGASGLQMTGMSGNHAVTAESSLQKTRPNFTTLNPTVSDKDFQLARAHPDLRTAEDRVPDTDTSETRTSPSTLVSTEQRVSRSHQQRLKPGNAPINTADSQGRKIRSYGRQQLLSIGRTPASRSRPHFLPDLPEIILKEPHFSEISTTFPVFTAGFFTRAPQFSARQSSRTRRRGNESRADETPFV